LGAELAAAAVVTAALQEDLALAVTTGGRAWRIMLATS
jgi:hypothetical protein